MFRLMLVLIFLIPFQRRFYRLLHDFSVSLIHPDWHFPAYFEIHLDWFITDFIMLALILGSLRFIRWRSFLWEGQQKYLTVFLLMALVSIIGSGYGSYPLHYWRWLHWALPALAFYAIGQKVLENFTAIAKVAVASSLLQCAIAIPQYFVQHSLGLKWLGEQTLISRHFLGAHFPMAGGSVSIFDRLFNIVRSHDYVIRAYGTLPHPNILGGMMVFGILMTYYLYGLGKRRGLLGLLIGVQAFCLVITYSRSALYAWCCATVIWLALDYFREKKISSIAWISGVSFLVCLVCFYPQLFERGGVVSYNSVTQGSDVFRLTLQDVGISMMRLHPLLGVGFNNYYVAIQTFVEAQQVAPMYVHNIYLLLGAEVGILGLLPFMAFCLAVLKRGWDSRQSPAIQISLVIFIAFLGIGLVDFYPLFSQQARMILFLSAALLFHARNVVPDAEPRLSRQAT
jgi:hypothetical protein